MAQPQRGTERPEKVLGPNIIAALIPRTISSFGGIGIVILYIIFTAGSGLGAALGGNIMVLALLGVVLVLLVYVAVAYFNLSNREYRFFDNEVEVYEGFLNISQDTISYDRVTDISFNRPIWQRLFGTGTILLNTAGGNTQEIRISYVDDPEREYNDIRDIVWNQQPAPGQQGTQAPQPRGGRGGGQQRQPRNGGGRQPRR